MNEKNLIPELRFPAFEKDGEWTVSSIDKLCDILNNIRKPVTSTNRTAGPYPYYGASGIIDFIDKFLFDERLLLIGEDGAKWGAYDNTAFLVEGKYWVNNHAHVLKPIGIDEKLLESYLVKLDLNPYITGAAPPKLTLRKLKEIPVPVPSTPEEQQKIASCLSSLDELIAAHKDKLDALKDHKKGLLQNLFPQEGETVPKVRFPEFEEAGEWVERKLGEVFNTFSGGTPKSTEKKYYGGSTPFIRSAEIAKNSTELFLTDEGLKNSSAKLVKKGDLLIALYGANSGDVAISKIDGAINQAILCLRSDFSNEFVSHYFFLKKDWITRRYLQGGQGNLSGQIVKSIELYFPKQEEQQKIASCLSALDELIMAQAEKIEQLKMHKKGLMQGLFPKTITN